MTSDTSLSPDDIALLDRYHTGIADERDVERARALLAVHRRERLFAEAVRLELRGAHTLPSSEDVHRRFQWFHNTVIAQHQINGNDVRRPHAAWQSQSRSRWATWQIRLGAFVVMGLLIVASIQLHRETMSSNLWKSARMTTYTTANGESARITLPDGSQVTLNVGSQLDVSTDFGRTNRSLRLTGEALFSVPHQTGIPFTVLSGNTTTKVLGTTFAIRRYASDTSVRVAVRDGKVAVGSVVLTGGQETTVGVSGPAPAQITQPRRFAFAQGSLIIEDLALPDAIPELNRWYNADIRLGDPLLATHRMMGTYEVGSLTDLISILELTFDVRVVREGRVLTLYPRG